MLRFILLSTILFPNLLLAQMNGSLTGLDKIYVKISMTTELEEHLSYTLLRTDVELKLRQNGIEVVDSSVNSHATLIVGINGFISSTEGFYVANVEICIMEYVQYGWRLEKDYNQAMTYLTSNVLKAGINDWDNVRDMLKDLVDVFLNDYLRDNPKK